MNFKVFSEDKCFFILKAFKNDSVEGIYKISKYHFLSRNVWDREEYINDLEEYVETFYEQLISDSILLEIDDYEGVL